jgi:hypothetical protein
MLVEDVCYRFVPQQASHQWELHRAEGESNGRQVRHEHKGNIQQVLRLLIPVVEWPRGIARWRCWDDIKGSQASPPMGEQGCHRRSASSGATAIHVLPTWASDHGV